VVTGTTGSATAAGAYTYVSPVPPVPVITGITPSHGLAAAKPSVTLTGINFTDTTEIYVDGDKVMTPITPGVNTLTFAMPPGNAGTVEIVVKDGTSASAAAFYTYTVAVNLGIPKITWSSRTNDERGTYFKTVEIDIE
jgi:hypothetical protein